MDEKKIRLRLEEIQIEEAALNKERLDLKALLKRLQRKDVRQHREEEMLKLQTEWTLEPPNVTIRITPGYTWQRGRVDVYHSRYLLVNGEWEKERNGKNILLKLHVRPNSYEKPLATTRRQYTGLESMQADLPERALELLVRAIRKSIG
jgi:hypothetical protein